MNLILAAVERLRRMIQSVQEFTLFTVGVFRSATPPFYWRETLHQLYFTGIGSLMIVIISATAAGSALALQLVKELATSGVKGQLGHFMVISVVRSLGPVLTGMIVASRMSAGITAEIGAMRSSDQIDALVAFGSDPMKRLVVPRLIALVIALPALTVIGDTLGVLGGGIVGHQYHLTWEIYIAGVFQFLTPKNVFAGMIKPFLFAAMIALVSCWKGFSSAGGAKGVGVSTTESVVISSVSILVLDGILTRLVFRFLHW